MKPWWKNISSKKSFVIRLIVNIIFFALAIFLLISFFSMSSLILIGSFMLLVTFFPLLQLHGKKILEHERVIAIYQFKNDMKVNVNAKKVFRGYFEIFLACWVSLILAFLPPWPHAWTIIFFPTVILYSIQIFVYAPSWDDFEYKKHRYYLLHLVISILCIVLSLTIKTIFYFLLFNN